MIGQLSPFFKQKSCAVWQVLAVAEDGTAARCLAGVEGHCQDVHISAIICVHV